MPERPAIIPNVFHQDPIVAMTGLEQAFGLDTLKEADHG